MREREGRRALVNCGEEMVGGTKRTGEVMVGEGQQVVLGKRRRGSLAVGEEKALDWKRIKSETRQCP